MASASRSSTPSYKTASCGRCWKPTNRPPRSKSDAPSRHSSKPSRTTRQPPALHPQHETRHNVTTSGHQVELERDVRADHDRPLVRQPEELDRVAGVARNGQEQPLAPAH